jgi:hypothetical protein
MGPKLQGWRPGRPGRDRREGARQRGVRRLFIVLDGGTATTRDLYLAAYPRLDPSERVPGWRWNKVRRAAERWAVRVGRRSRPLLWRAKPEVFK